MTNQKKCENDANFDVKWEDIFDYIKDKIFKYDNTKKLPRNLVLRIKGLAVGQYYRNTKQKEMAHYSLETIYATLIFCTDEVIKSFEKAKDENHKINLLCFILDKYINTMQERIAIKKANESKINLLDNTSLTGVGNNSYVPKPKKKIDEERW